MQTIEETIEIPTADGACDGLLLRPARGRAPGVIHLTDIGGIRPAHLELARKVAGWGYTVLVPNVFFRTGRPPLLDFTPSPGDPRTVQRFAELTGPLTPEVLDRDAAGWVDFLAESPAVAEGPMGVVGHCYAGAVALRTAAVRKGRIAAAASLHGGWLFTDAPTSPHLLLPRIEARLYFAHASEDRSMPAEAIAKFEEALRAWGGRFESETFPARHGWTASDREVYDRAQAERAYGNLKSLLDETVG